MTEIPSTDPYRGIMTLSDINYAIRTGTFGFPRCGLISSSTADRLVSTSALPLMPTRSNALMRQAPDMSQLPDSVQARISVSPIYNLLLKMMTPIRVNHPIPLTLQSNGIASKIANKAPPFYVEAFVSYTDTNGVTNSKLQPGQEYWLKKPTSGSGARQATYVDFRFDGQIDLRTSDTSAIVSERPLTSTFSEAEEAIAQIKQKKVITSISIQASSLLASVFKACKTKASATRSIKVSPEGLEISGTIDGTPSKLDIKTGVPSTSYSFKEVPKETLTGRILTDGIESLGKSINCPNIIMTLYSEYNSFYYLRFFLPFSEGSNGSIYVPVSTQVIAAHAPQPVVIEALKPTTSSNIVDLGEDTVFEDDENN